MSLFNSYFALADASELEQAMLLNSLQFVYQQKLKTSELSHMETVFTMLPRKLG
jgi:hypothetical protein